MSSNDEYQHQNNWKDEWIVIQDGEFRIMMKKGSPLLDWDENKDKKLMSFKMTLLDFGKNEQV